MNSEKTKKKKLSLLLIFITLTSCGTLVKNISGFKNPKVENRLALNSYFKEVMPNEKTYFLSVEKIRDSAAIYENFLFAFSSEMKIFSNSGQKYCYDGISECNGSQMISAFGEFDKTFVPCVENSNEDLKNLIAKLVDKEGKRINFSDLPESDYYIFQFWDKYSNSRKRLKNDSKWISNLKQNTKLDVSLIFINGDLIDDWGMKKNGVLKTKFRKNDKGLSFDITFGKLPLIE